MARIPGVEKAKAGWWTRIVYGMVRKRLGKVPEPLEIAAHHPWMFRGVGAFEYMLAHAKLVDAKLTALAGLKASSLVGCPW